MWNEFALAMETKNLEYLIKNSFDTIQCIDCIINNKSENLDKLMHLDSLTNIEFSTYTTDSIIRVSYSVKWKLAPEGA